MRCLFQRVLVTCTAGLDEYNPSFCSSSSAVFLLINGNHKTNPFDGTRSTPFTLTSLDGGQVVESKTIKQRIYTSPMGAKPPWGSRERRHSVSLSALCFCVFLYTLHKISTKIKPFQGFQGANFCLFSIKLRHKKIVFSLCLLCL